MPTVWVNTVPALITFLVAVLSDDSDELATASANTGPGPKTVRDGAKRPVHGHKSANFGF
jgi:hypothetical protein